MRVVQRIGFVLLLSSLLAAQSGPPADSENSKMQKLLDAMAAQQKAIAEQQQQISQQQQAISQQQQEIEKLKQQLNSQAGNDSRSSDSQLGRAVNASLTVPNGNPAVRTVSDMVQEPVKESPLSFKIGGAEFTPGGFMDFTGIFRSTNTTNTGGTNFFAIPYSNQILGHLTETRLTAQNSRISLKATDKFGKNDVTGYVEVDFLGNDGGNVFVTSNSHTLRQRLYFVDVKREKWEVLAGQAWSWLTPNRTGLSPYPADIFYSQDMDFNYQAGLTWTRAPQVRFAYHPNDNWAFGVALENPQQYAGQTVGSQQMVIFPANGFAAQLAGQLDQGATPGAPNVHPDIIPKITYDTNMGGKHFHAEAAGLITSFRITNIPETAGATFVKHTKTGGGASAAVNLEVIKNFRIVANGFYSDGGGRYIFGMAPGTVVFPVNAPGATCTATATQPTGCDLALSLVHSGSAIFGFEAQLNPKVMLYGYYGGAYIARNFAPDLTVLPNGAGFRPSIGYGWPGVFGPGNVVEVAGSSTADNRAVQEPTVGWIQTFWKNPQYGALQLITQGSYITRAPWFVAAGAPKNAHLFMGWADLRYILP